MRMLFFFSIIIVLFSNVQAQHSMQEPFQLRAAKLGLVYSADIPLPGGISRFDYQSIDTMARRLYISHMGANSVIVFDLDSRKVVGVVKDIPAPTGILVVPSLQRIYVSASSVNQVFVINSTTLKTVDKIPTRRFPDGIAFDPKNERVFVSNELGKAVTVFDARTNKPLTNINMGGEVGNTHYDGTSNVIYSAVQSADELVAIDPNTLKVIARYKLPGCKGPHGFYIDEETHYAIITGEDDATYVVFDLTSHRILAHGSVGNGPDVLAFDHGTHRLYVASESGAVTLFEIKAQKVEKVGDAFFEEHAHTISVDGKSHLVLFPLQDLGGRPILRIMKEIGR